MVSFAGESSKLQAEEFPGITGTPEGQMVARALAQILGGGVGPLGGQLTQTLTSDAALEQALLGGVTEQIGGQNLPIGLGATSEDALSQAIAPTLLNTRNQEISNLMAALDPQLQRREQDIAGLISLGELLMPQRIGGTQGQGFGIGIVGESREQNS